MSLDNIYLKYLIRAHTIIGIFVIFFFFISTYFGTITVFKPYISSWESPSRHFEVLKEKKLDLDKAIPVALNALENPDDRVEINLPSFKDNALSAKFGFSQMVYVNPFTNELLDTKNENNFLSTFFNSLHVNLNLSRPGQIVMGICSVAIIFLTITGLYLWLLNRKKRTKEKNTWFKWHKDISLIILPYILIFAMTGAVLGLMLSSASPFAYSATDGKETIMGKIVRPVLFPAQGRIKKSDETVSMESFSSLYEKASDSYKNLNITKVNLYKWNDKNAQIIFSGYLKDNRILTGNVNRASITLSGHTGVVLDKRGLGEAHTLSKFLSGFYFFHFLPDEKVVVRVLYLVLGIAFAISLVFGLLIWIEKSRNKYKGDDGYFNLVSKFTLALCIGIIPASTFLIFLYWVLPFDILQRDTWLMGGFYVLWSFTLFYSIYERETLKSLRLFIALASLFLFLSVFMHGINTGVYMWNSLKMNLSSVFWVDLSFVLLAILFFIFAINIPKIKFLEKFKGL